MTKKNLVKKIGKEVVKKGWPLVITGGVAIGGCTNFGHPLMLAIGQASKSFIAIGLSAIVQLAILIIFLPGMGITAAGIAYIGFYLIWSVIMIISVRIIWQKY